MTTTITSDQAQGITVSTNIAIASTVAITNAGGPDAVEAIAHTGIMNFGTIAGLADGVALDAGGTVNNQEGAIISGAAGIVAYGSGAVYNAGYISGFGVGIEANKAAITNASTGRISGGIQAVSGTVINSGTIETAIGTVVDFSGGGTVDNFGASSYLAGGDVIGVQISGGAGTLDNEGTILGVNLAFGGSVTNAGYIMTGNAAFAIEAAGAPVAIVNSGRLVGVAIYDGGSITNSAGGVISGYQDGISLKLGGSVTNSGQVLGIGGRFHAVEHGNAGIVDSGSALIQNLGTGAVIQGSTDGIELLGSLTGNVTIINDGTIAGAQAGILVSGSLTTTIIDDGSIIGAPGSGIVLDGGTNFISFGSAAVVSGIVVGGDVNDPVVLTLEGPVPQNLDLQIETGGSVLLDGPVAAGESLVFTGPGGIISLGDPAHFEGTIFSMQSGDEIDMPNLVYTGAGTVVLESGNWLSISEDGQTFQLQLDPNQKFGSTPFHIGSDAVGGTDVFEGAVPCFLKDTRIEAVSGEVLVQDVRIGDMLLCAGGTRRPVKWIGRRRYAHPLPDDPDIIPVHLQAGALADNVPARDLYISPRHAIVVDDYLIPAGALLNGRSVRAATEITEIEYFHIEMESHDIIFANGAAAETFIDDHSRRMFDNAAEYDALYPQAPLGDYALCKPRLEFGPILESLRRKVALRAGVALGQPADEAVIGFLEVADRQTITGWAYAPGSPNTPVSLEILDGGAVLARCVANIPRSDVKAAGFGNGRCGFEIRLPAPLPALTRHEISVRPVGQKTCLTGSPVVIDPAINDDLLRAGGLAALIDAAVQSSATPADISLLGRSLVIAGQSIQLRHGHAPGATMARPLTRPITDQGRPVVLMLDDAWPTPTRDAGSNALISHVRAFQDLGHHVVFCATSGAPANRFAAAGVQQLLDMGVECHGQDGIHTEAVIRGFVQRRLDVVYLHRFATASTYITLVRHHLPVAKIVYAVADLHHLRLGRQAAVTNRPDILAQAKSVEASELWAMRLADVVLTHSSFEAEYLLQLAPRANVRIVPWAIKPRMLPRHPLPAPRRDIAFIGGPDHAPNLDAVNHLARDIMPLVWAQDPTIRCLVAGPGWTGNFFAKLDPRMVNHGYVTSLEPLLHAVKFTVAPLRFGAGVKGKVFDSIAAGTPCLMSDIAAEGLPLDLLLQDAVADGPAMALKILAAYKDGGWRRALTRAGTAMLKEHFSEKAVVTALAAAIGVPEHRFSLPDVLQPMPVLRRSQRAA